MPKKPARPERPRHDASYKSFFARRRTVADTLRGAASNLARQLDLSTLQRLPASFVTKRLGQRHADMLWRVRTADGGWLYLLVLLEFQSTIDRRMALRMTDYTLRILRGLDPSDLGPRGEYPPILPIVVYNGERRWNAATDIGDLFAPVSDELLGYLPRQRYLVIDLQALDPSRLPSENVLAMLAKFEQAGTPERLAELVASLSEWLERTGDAVLASRLRVWVRLVLARQFGAAEGSELGRRIRNEEEADMTLMERARKWGEERNREWLARGIEQGRQEGIERGRQEGIERGRQEGIERGRQEGERELVRRLVARRFGTGASEHIAPILAGVPDADRLAAIAAEVFECESVDELVDRIQRRVSA